MADDFCSGKEDYEEPWIRQILDDVCYNIVKISVEQELGVKVISLYYNEINNIMKGEILWPIFTK